MGKSKVALITGVTGQDGAFLTQLLLSKGYHVHGIKRRSSQINTKRIDHLYKKIQDKNSKLSLHYGDLTDSTNILKLVRAVEPDEIYNLGAQSHVQVSFETPEYTTNVDALGTLRILEAIHILGLKDKTRFYQASTSELYGKVQETPQSETTPFYPRSPYGVAKLYAYWATINYREAYGIYGCNGILFNHESPIRGETFVTRKITRTAARIALGIEDCLYIGNLNAQRDWGHAKEYVEGMWRMLQQDTPDDFVLATGKMTTVREMARLAFKHAGIELEFEGTGEKEIGRCKSSGIILVQQDPRYYRPAEVELLIGNPAKAEEKLGWSAKIGMDELVEEMVAADIYRTEQRHFGKYRSAPSAEELVHEEGGFCAWKQKSEEKISA